MPSRSTSSCPELGTVTQLSWGEGTAGVRSVAREPRPPPRRSGPSDPAHLAALAFRAAQLLVGEAVQIRVSAADEAVAGPANGALRVGW